MTEIKQYNSTICKLLLSNITECNLILENDAIQGKPTRPPRVNDVDTDLIWWHHRLYPIVLFGLAISFITLFVSLCIFISLRRLQNTRVRIHINFFAAVALESLAWLILLSIFGYETFLISITEDLHIDDDISVLCRALMIFGNYFELSSFTWVSMESWYFFNFICRTPYKGLTSIKPLLLPGWGVPLIIITTYVIIYASAVDTNFCWVDVDIKMNIVAIPVFIMVLINVCLFCLSVKVLFCKLNCSVTHQRQKNFWKWFKSTLMLVPLFGAYYIFFSIEPWLQDKYVKAYFVNALQIVCSFHGFLIATLYCFMNNEVKTEIARAWNNWRSKKEIYCKHCERLRERRKVAKKNERSGSSSDKSESVTLSLINNV
ncbi:secretin receptor-like [Trichogramma pretiosum]|uniref:secretin receptor-like n=1 Tax=Trichogramma pretiosum TaxID=7493 RepID=UPI0006C98081|nr:secretin receptor-like [Trichogramma pretiosum]